MLSSVPFEFPSYLSDLCKGLPPVSTAIVSADSTIVLESARAAAEAGFIKPFLIGDSKKIQTSADTINWDIREIPIVHAPGELRAPKTAVAMARGDEVKALMKGQIHTDSLMLPVIDKQRGLLLERRLSHVFHMTIPKSKKVLMITDGAVNVMPNIKTKIDIIKNAIDLAHALNIFMPKVALLSGTETPIPSMPSSQEAKQLVTLMAQGLKEEALIDGPFALDNAISSEAAYLKGISGPVAGNADILVVPNIETGNSLFKMMVYFMSAVAAGIVLGGKVPIMLTSRGDPPEARVASAALANLIAHKTL